MADLSGTTGGRTIGLIVSPLSVKLTQTLGITLSTYAASQTLTSTFLTVPAILRLPVPLLLQESARLRTSDTIAKSLYLPSTFAFAWLARNEPTSATQASKLYVASAALLSTASLYSLLLTASVSRELARRDAGAESAKWLESGSQLPVQKESYEGTTGMFRRWFATGNDLFFPILRNSQMSVHELVDRWALWNAGGAVVVALGAVMGTWGVVGNDTSIFELFQMAAEPQG